MTRAPAATPYRIRAIASDDREALTRFYAGLSADSMVARFHGATAGIGGSVARDMCGLDHDHREGFVAELVDDRPPGVIIGHICVEPLSSDDAEMAIAVADTWQHHGVGRALLAAAITWARAHRMHRIVASARWSNGAILGLVRASGRPVTFGASDGGVVDILLDLGSVVSDAA